MHFWVGISELATDHTTSVFTRNHLESAGVCRKYKERTKPKT